MKDMKCISETKCTFVYLLSLPLKLKARLKDAQFIFWIFIALSLYLLCIIYFVFVLFCLCGHLASISILIWINILPFISETVNCIGCSFLYLSLLIICDRHSILKHGELLILCPNAVFLIIKGTFKGQACFILQAYYWQPPTMWVEISCPKTKFIPFLWQTVLPVIRSRERKSI